MSTEVRATQASQQSKSDDTGHLTLSYRVTDRKLIVDPEDHDKFESSVNEAVAACKNYKERLRFGRQYDRLMLEALPAWIDKRRNKIKHAIVTLQDSRLLFLVVRKEVEHDPEFESELIELDLQLARDIDLNLIRLSVLDLPDCSDEAVEGFIDCTFSLWYKHAQQKRAPRARRKVQARISTSA